MASRTSSWTSEELRREPMHVARWGWPNCRSGCPWKSRARSRSSRLEGGRAKTKARPVQRRILEHNTATPAGSPDDATALLRAAEQQFEALGQLGLRVYIEACAASGIVNNVAINNRSLRANNYFGLGTPA